MNQKINAQPVLRMVNIDKSFSGVSVLEGVDFDAYRGEILAVLGQNGAGKSTLMKILAGVYPFGSYSGKILINDKECKFADVKMAEQNGVVMIPQEVEIFPNLTVAENLYFNRLSDNRIIDWNSLYAQAEKDLKEFGILDISPRDIMGNLVRAQHQLILITKALLQSEGRTKTNVLILDEPTASLSDSETQVLFKHMETIKKSGVACIYISHRLGEVFKISDRFFIMRDGRTVGKFSLAETSMEGAITTMVGGQLKRMKKSKEVTFGKKLLEVKGLTVYDKIILDRLLVNNIDLNLHEGEILGVFGLVGSGKTEMAMGIYGAWEGKSSSEIKIDGNLVVIDSPQKAIESGIGFLPEDRRQALLDVRSIRENMVLIILRRFSNKLGILDRQKEKKEAMDLQTDLKLKARTLEDNPSTLSGGNKQKALIARLLGAKSRILIVDEPTVGVDINTRQDLYGILRRYVEENKCAILLFSSDVEEVLQVSDQIMVVRNGNVAAFYGQEQIGSGTVDQDVLVNVAVAHE